MSTFSEQVQETISFIRELYNEPNDLIPLHAPIFVGNEKKYLNDCIDSTFVSSVGKYVELFEEKIVELTGARRAVACVNGTNALHLALILAGVSQDQEVITQPLTFVATVNAIQYCNASPVFVDVDKDTLGMSPESLDEFLKNETREDTITGCRINKKTNRTIGAILPMHTFGFPCRIDKIVEVGEKYNLPIIEDAAESLGSYFKERHTGTFGKIGVISFNGNKIITTGGGGILLFMDEMLANKAKHLSTQAKVAHPWEFIHNDIGYNYRMPNINAALGLAQFEQLSSYLENKRKIANAYHSFFLNKDFEFFSEPLNTKSNYWLNTILVKNKKEKEFFLKITNDSKVMTRPVWTLMNKLEMFRNCQTMPVVNAEWLVDKLINIPSSVINI